MKPQLKETQIKTQDDNVRGQANWGTGTTADTARMETSGTKDSIGDARSHIRGFALKPEARCGVKLLYSYLGQDDIESTQRLDETAILKTPFDLQNEETEMSPILILQNNPDGEEYVIDAGHIIAADFRENEFEMKLEKNLNRSSKDDLENFNEHISHFEQIEFRSESSMITKSECNQLCKDTVSLKSQSQTPKSTPRQVKRTSSRLPVTKFYSNSTLQTSTQGITPPAGKTKSRSRTPNPKSSTNTHQNAALRPGSATASRTTKSIIPIQQPVKRVTNTKVAQEKPAPTPVQPKEEENQTMYTSKQMEFIQLKKDLDFRQQEILRHFTTLKEMRQQVGQESHEDLVLPFTAELQIFNVANWTSEELGQLCRDSADASKADTTLEVIENIKTGGEVEFEVLKTNVIKIPSAFADFCVKALTTRQELVDWLKSVLNAEDELEMARITNYDMIGYQLCEDLRCIKEGAVETIHYLIEHSGKSYEQRKILIAAAETLIREVARLKLEVEKHSDQLNEMRVSQTKQSDRAQKPPASPSQASADPQLRQARARVLKLEKQLREAEIANSSLTNNFRNQEEQIRQREIHFEARIRKVKDALKTSENANIQIARERDALQDQFKDLSDNLAALTKSHLAEVDSLTSQIKELSKSLDGFREQLKLELETKESLQERLKSADQQIRELSTKVSHFESSTHNSDLPTEREINLWADLQMTKQALQTAEEEMNICKLEKVRYMETFTKISENDSVNSVSSMQQKLASELATKEETVSQLQTKIRELKKAKDLNEKKVVQYEQYVKDLHQYTRSIISGKDNPNLVSYQELQDQVMSLRMSLMEAADRNDELLVALTQREAEQEQQEKAVRAQAKTLKVREELINMLKNKETEQSRELTELQFDLEKRLKIVEEVNQQIAAKADEIQQLFETLEGKQQQIHRLEKIVVALEEQQRRAHAQRTRHEEKIASLEHELAAAHQRERKFLFF